MTKLKVYKVVNRARCHEIEVAPTFNKYGDLLTVRDIADETGLCCETIRSCIKSGELPGVRIGQKFFVPKTKMLEFLGVI